MTITFGNTDPFFGPLFFCAIAASLVALFTYLIFHPPKEKRGERGERDTQDLDDRASFLTALLTLFLIATLIFGGYGFFGFTEATPKHILELQSKRNTISTEHQKQLKDQLNIFLSDGKLQVKEARVLEKFINDIKEERVKQNENIEKEKNHQEAKAALHEMQNNP